MVMIKNASYRSTNSIMYYMNIHIYDLNYIIFRDDQFTTIHYRFNRECNFISNAISKKILYPMQCLILLKYPYELL